MSRNNRYFYLGKVAGFLHLPLGFACRVTDGADWYDWRAFRAGYRAAVGGVR